jgi:hypothetical protein
MHRAESIMQAITTNLTGLATTGANVHRGRVYSLAAVPALSISMGSDENLSGSRTWPYLTRRLQVIITAHVKTTTQLETQLNQIKTEVFAALNADISQGLAFVIDTELAIDEQPELDAEQDQPTARCDMQWTILYRHSNTSTEA